MRSFEINRDNDDTGTCLKREAVVLRDRSGMAESLPPRGGPWSHGALASEVLGKREHRTVRNARSGEVCTVLPITALEGKGSRVKRALVLIKSREEIHPIHVSDGEDITAG